MLSGECPEVHVEKCKMPSCGGNCKTPIWAQIRAFCAGFGFRTKRLLSIEYVILRGSRTCTKIIEFELQSEFCNSLYVFYRIKDRHGLFFMADILEAILFKK